MSLLVFPLPCARLCVRVWYGTLTTVIDPIRYPVCRLGLRCGHLGHHHLLHAAVPQGGRYWRKNTHEVVGQHRRHQDHRLYISLALAHPRGWLRAREVVEHLVKCGRIVRVPATTVYLRARGSVVAASWIIAVVANYWDLVRCARNTLYARLAVDVRYYHTHLFISILMLLLDVLVDIWSKWRRCEDRIT